MNMVRARLVLIAVLPPLTLACGESAAPSESSLAQPTAPAPVDFAPTLSRLGAPSDAFEVTAARPYGALACMRGEIDGLDLLLCRYPDATAAEAATSSLRDFVLGAVSGVIRSAGGDSIAIADRNKVDPTGERIAELEAAFSKE